MSDAGNIIQFIRFGGIVPAIALLIVVGFTVHFTSRFAERLGQRFTERRLLFHQAATVLRFLFYITGITAALALSFQLSEQMLLAVGGSLAVAFGIALKDLAASLVAGLTILFDRPFQVGDRVSFAGFYGEIKEIGLRSVRLVTLDDNLVTIPNNKFLTDAVASGNAGALDMLVQMDFYVGVDQDLDLAESIVRGAITTTRFAFLSKPWSIVIAQVVHESYFAVRLRAKVYVLDVKYETALVTDVTRRVMRGFAEIGVRPPAVLHRDVAAKSAAITRAA